MYIVKLKIGCVNYMISIIGVGLDSTIFGMYIANHIAAPISKSTFSFSFLKIKKIWLYYILKPITNSLYIKVFGFKMLIQFRPTHHRPRASTSHRPPAVCNASQSDNNLSKFTSPLSGCGACEEKCFFFWPYIAFHIPISSKPKTAARTFKYICVFFF